MEDLNVSQCRKCGTLEVREQDGYFPDGRNKRFVNKAGGQWSGRSCPNCVRRRVKDQIKQKRADAKSRDVTKD